MQTVDQVVDKLATTQILEEDVLSHPLNKIEVDFIHYERYNKKFIDVWGFGEKELVVLANKMAEQFKVDVVAKTKKLNDPVKEQQRQDLMDKYIVKRAVNLLARFCKLSTEKHIGKQNAK